MTTAIPEENPGQHNAGELITGTMALRQQIVDMDTAAAGAGSVVRHIPGVWQGKDATACTALLNSIQEHLKRVSGNLVGQLAGVDRYRQDLQEIFRSFKPIRARAEEAREWLRQHPDPAATGIFYQGGMSADAEVAYVRLLAERRLHIDQIASCQRAVEGLWEQRRTADRAAVAALATHRVSDWKSARQQLEGHGITDPRRASPAQVAEVMAARSREILRGHPPGAGSYSQLKDLLDAYGYSAEHMDAFFTALGGTEAALLVGSFPASREGGPGGESSDFPQAMRSAFVLASQRWDESEAAAIAAKLLPEIGLEALAHPDFEPSLIQDLRAGHTGLAYLLSGAAIGAPLALALARRVDQRERIQNSPVQGETSTPLTAILQAQTMQAGTAYRAAERLNDPAGLVFSQLAHSPEASYTFLTETEGADRIRHWYGRDWQAVHRYDADRFEGAFAVWAAASVHPASFDAPEWDQLAAGSGLIVTTLAGNPHFQEDELSPAAVGSLTFAMVLQLPGLLESSFIRETHRDPGEGVVAQVRMPDGTTRSAAVLDDGAVASVISRIYQNGGAATMDAFTTDYSVALTRHASATNNPHGSLAAAQRLVELNSLMDAAKDGMVIRVAGGQDESAMAIIKPAETVAGLLPLDKVPGFALLAQPVRKGLLGLTDYGISEGASLAEALWASNERRAVSTADGREQLRALQVRSAVIATLAEAFTLPEHTFDASALDPDPVKAEKAYRAWIDMAEPAVDQEIVRRLNDLADKGGVSREVQPVTVGEIVAEYEEDYEGMRNAVTR